MTYLMNSTIERMVRLFKALIFLMILLAAIHVAGQDYQEYQGIIEQIKKQTSVYKYGEGRGSSQAMADAAAEADLAKRINGTVSVNNGSNMSYDPTTGGDESVSSAIDYSSTVNLRNAEYLRWEKLFNEETTDYFTFVYVGVEDLRAAEEERRNQIVEWVAEGINQEKMMNIAGALRYYNWAYATAAHFNDRVKVWVNDTEKDALTWLPNKIESVLGNIRVSAKPDGIIYTPDDFDKYHVIFDVTYGGHKVSGLDLNYFNGQRNVRSHAKDGEAALLYPSAPEGGKINIRIEYAYRAEAEAGYDESLKSAIKGGSDYKAGALSSLSIPCTFKNNEVKIKPNNVAVAEKAKLSAEARKEEVLYKEPRKTIDRDTLISNDMMCILKMQKVEQAIRSNDLATIDELFTPDGLKSFKRMTREAKLTVVGHPEYRVEKTDLVTIGKGIPLSVKTRKGNHVTKEKLVFRFDNFSGKISSVAYALTERAENDIFRKADWNINSRYSLLQFMEDYQTAFMVKDSVYIKNVFSDNAIIIIGTFSKGGKSKFIESNQIISGNKQINYKRWNKDQYMANLRQLMKTKDWVHISFEENEISKIETGDQLGNSEALWIEIRQNWSVSGGYNDTGYLALQINLKPQGSQINVRTFTPEFIDLNELKRRFPIGS